MSRCLPGFVAIVVLAVCCAPAHADQQTYEFRKNYRDGQQFSVLFSHNLQIAYRVIARGRSIEAFRRVDAVQDKGLLTILKTNGGIPVSERIELDPASGEFIQTSGEQPKQEYTKLAGKEITVSRDPTGIVSVDLDGEPSPQLTREFENWLDRDEELYPDHPVRVKEKWDLSQKLAPAMKLEKDARMQALCRLNAVKTVRGRQFAELQISCGIVTRDRKYRGLNLEEQMEGTAWVDLATGRVAKIDLSGEVNVSGVVEVRTASGSVVPVATSGDGKIEYHQLVIASRQRKDTVAVDVDAQMVQP